MADLSSTQYNYQVFIFQANKSNSLKNVYFPRDKKNMLFY